MVYGISRRVLGTFGESIFDSLVGILVSVYFAA